jgi:hypothetical protein
MSTNFLLGAKNSLSAHKNSLSLHKKFPVPQRLAGAQIQSIKRLSENLAVAE